MGLAENIRIRRMELNISQQELANVLGYRSRSTIAKIESGDNDIPLGKLQAFADALDTSADFLLTGCEGEGQAKLPAFVSGNLIATADAIDDIDDSLNWEPAPETHGGRTVAVILAGGKSTRNQQNTPNQFVSIMGRPMISYVMETYQRHPLIDEMVIVCARGWESIVSAYASEYGIRKLTDIVPAGPSGTLSARNAVLHLLETHSRDDCVILQESTRPLTSPDTVTKALQLYRAKGNAVVCEPMRDYVQFIRENAAAHYLDRNRIVCMQSPEVHQLGALADAFAEAAQKSNSKTNLLGETYVAMMLYNLGRELNFCVGNPNNIKAVRANDITIISALIQTGH